MWRIDVLKHTEYIVIERNMIEPAIVLLSLSTAGLDLHLIEYTTQKKKQSGEVYVHCTVYTEIILRAKV